MKREYKFKFWHLITNINRNEANRRKELQIGNFVTHRYALDGRPTFINLKEHREFWLYDIIFIAKVRTETTMDELKNILESKAKEKGYEKYLNKENVKG